MSAGPEPGGPGEAGAEGAREGIESVRIGLAAQFGCE